MAKPHEVWFGWMHGKQFKLKKDSHVPGYKEGDLVKAVMVSRMGDVGVTKDLTATLGYDLRLFPHQLEPIEPITGDICKLCHLELSAFSHADCSLDRKCDRCKGETGPADAVCHKCLLEDFKKGVR